MKVKKSEGVYIFDGPFKDAVAEIVRAQLKRAAEIVRKKRESRSTYHDYSADEETRARNAAVEEAVESALWEIADALEAASEP